MDIETCIYSSDNGGSTTDYVAVLRSESGDRDIKTYSNHNDPELEILNYRLNNFIKNPEEKLVIPFQYYRWGPFIIFCLMFCVYYVYLRFFDS